MTKVVSAVVGRTGGVLKFSEAQMDIRARLVEICDAFNAHDLDRIMRFFADDCVLEMPKGNKPYGSRFEGKQNVREGLAARFEGLPDVHYGNAEHFVDSAISQTGISKWCLTGTGRDGKRVEVRVAISTHSAQAKWFERTHTGNSLIRTDENIHLARDRIKTLRRRR